jgi:hypothetical protein
MSSADISYQRNQQNPENKSYTSIPDNKQNHFLGKRKTESTTIPESSAPKTGDTILHRYATISTFNVENFSFNAVYLHRLPETC